MSKITEVNVHLCLPNGAYFKENINLVCLKSLFELVNSLSCVSNEHNCKKCLAKEDCDYHKSTGENFQYYPGILVYNDLFTKNIYAKEEILKIRFYLIGNNQKWSNYIRLLFELYLKNHLDGYVYILESIDISELDSKLISIGKVSLVSMIESQNFIQSYNSMMEYYNAHYGTDFHLIPGNEVRIDSFKHSSMDHFIVGNVNIHPQGYLYRIFFYQSLEIENIVKQIGIGKFSFIGGGRFED